MANWIVRWIASGVALAVVAHLHIGVHYDTLEALAVATVVMGLVNSLIRPILFVLTLPLTCLTFGLFGFLLNACLFGFAGNSVPGFHVDGPWAAIIGSALMGILSGMLNSMLADREKE